MLPRISRFTRRKAGSDRRQANSTASPSRSMSARNALRLSRGSSDSRPTPGSSASSTEYPGRNWVSPITAKPASSRRSTEGFSPARALPILSVRQS